MKSKKQLIESAVMKIIKKVIRESIRDNIVDLFVEWGGFDDSPNPKQQVMKEYGKEVMEIEKLLSTRPVNWPRIFELVDAKTPQDKQDIKRALSAFV